MRKMGRGLVVVVVGLALGWAGQAGAASGGLPQCQVDLETCTTDLNTSNANLATCTTNLNTCNAGLVTCTTNLNTSNANLATCTTNLNASNANLATCTADLNACNVALAAAQQFPATGQTTCWDNIGGGLACAGTGQDGDIQAGAALSYTDNGNGTITDNNTGLMWAKKSDDGTIHDKDTTYTWANAFAVHIAGLNAGTGFAGYTDWRLPNVKELQSIVNYENTSPAVSPEFNSNCAAACAVPNCSCTAAGNYWTSSSYDGSHAIAWYVLFVDGSVSAFGKGSTAFVRAVRGGL